MHASATEATHPYKMKDLCALTGLPRQAIHFYIQQGLVPPGRKTGRNMAWYGELHVERLSLVKKLQRERFLPLKAIKALFEGRDEQFTAAQMKWLKGVKAQLAGSVARDTDDERPTEDITSRLAELGIEPHEVARAVEIGLVGAIVEEDGRVLIASDDRWVVENMGQMRAAGFTPDLGFSVDDFERYVETLDGLFRGDAERVSRRLSHLPRAVVARMIERALPVIQEFMTRYHDRRVRDFFSSM